MSFLKELARSEKQTNMSRIWTPVVDFISVTLNARVVENGERERGKARSTGGVEIENDKVGGDIGRWCTRFTWRIRLSECHAYKSTSQNLSGQWGLHGNAHLFSYDINLSRSHGNYFTSSHLSGQWRLLGSAHLLSLELLVRHWAMVTMSLYGISQGHEVT